MRSPDPSSSSDHFLRAAWRRTRSYARAARRSAFTLVELAIVLLVMGILAGAGAPRYIDALAKRRVDCAALRLAADLNYARHYAQSASAPLTIDFDVANNAYQIDGMPDVVHRGSTHAVRLSNVSEGVALLAADFSGAPTFTFDIYGRPSQSGAVALACRGFQAQVRVLATGATEVP